MPTALIHTPWQMDEAAQRAAGVVIGRDYPLPVVDPIEAARIARDRIWAVRKGGDFAQAADAIQQRHGSRKAGLPPTTRPRREKPAAPQLGLDFDRD